MNESVGIIAAIVFFLIFAGAAYVAFRLLRKTVKMAFRMVIVALILAIAVAGSVSLWWLAGSKSGAQKTKQTQRK
jgi:NhaP-type Na+/H+ or K+/H+ antiporter